MTNWSCKMLTNESWDAIVAICEARKAKARQPDRWERTMGIIVAVGEWNSTPTDEACAKIVMRALALAAEQGVDLDAAIAKATAKFGKPLPEGGSRLSRQTERREASEPPEA